MFNIQFPTEPGIHKEQIIAFVRRQIAELQFPIVEEFTQKPWGFMFRFSERIIPRFIELFFKNDHIEVTSDLMLSPKFLIITPHARLSWQFHHRRSELWKVIGGTVASSISDSDEEGAPKKYVVGDLIVNTQGQRHRLMGLDGWGYVAEIWQHTDPLHPSDEEDIVRLSDDFGREGITKPV